MAHRNRSKSGPHTPHELSADQFRFWNLLDRMFDNLHAVARTSVKRRKGGPLAYRTFWIGAKLATSGISIVGLGTPQLPDTTENDAGTHIIRVPISPIPKSCPVHTLSPPSDHLSKFRCRHGWAGPLGVGPASLLMAAVRAGVARPGLCLSLTVAHGLSPPLPGA